MSEFLKAQQELAKRFAREGKGSTTMDERVALGYARCAVFTQATQNKGTPGCRGSYGTGKREE